MQRKHLCVVMQNLFLTSISKKVKTHVIYLVRKNKRKCKRKTQVQTRVTRQVIDLKE